MSDYILTSRYISNELNENSMDDVLERVSKTIYNDPKMLELLKSKRFSPGGRTLAYAGVPNKRLNPNCVALPLHSKTNKIVNTLCRGAILQRVGTGNGFNFNNILYNDNIKIVKHFVQMDVYHPDIYSFINKNFNNITKIVKVDEQFMLDALFNPSKKMIMRNINYDNKCIVADTTIKEKRITVGMLYGIIKHNGIKLNIIDNYETFRVHDTFESIMFYLENSYMHRVSLDFSELRKCWAKCNGADTKSSGPVAFIHAFNILYNTVLNRSFVLTWIYTYSSLFNIIQQHGRSGAQIAILPIDNPYIIDFIHLKDDKSVINNFNISILITEDFMNKLENSPNSVTDFKTYYTTYDENFIPLSRDELSVTYKELWEEFMQSAYNSGEPGALFEKNMNRDNFVEKYFGKINCCNPCVIAGTKLLTKEYGNIDIEKCVGERVNVWSGDSWELADVMETGQDQDVYKIILDNGKHLTCTKNHKFLKIQRASYLQSKCVKTELCKLSDNDQLFIGSVSKMESVIECKNSNFTDLYAFGYYCGSKGNLVYVNSKNEDHIKLFIKYRYVMCNDEPGKFKVIGIEDKCSRGFIPDCKTYNIKSRMTFYSGLIDAAGTIYSKNITINIENRNYAVHIANSFMELGIKCSLYGNNNILYTIFISEYDTNKLFDLGLFCHLKKREESFLNKFIDLFKMPEKRSDVNDIAKIEIIEKLPDKADKVYCVNVLYDSRHVAMFNGILTSNCGEISMFTNECCNLGSLNIKKYTKKVKDGCKCIDDILDNFMINEFKEGIELGIRFLDKVIDLLDIPDKELLDNVRLFRRLGLGLFGFSHALLKLKVPYGSELARDFAKYLSKVMYDEANKTSYKIAIETGNSLRNRMLKKGIISMKEYLSLGGTKYDRANIALLCAAPTGSIAMLYKTSYSIEPEYQMIYKRAYKANDKEDDYFINKYFKEYLVERDLWNDRNMESICVNGLNGELFDSKGEKVIIDDYDKEVYKTALDLTPNDHILMQAAFQTYFDNSISKTINFKNNAKISDISNAFIKAYKIGIKGMTIYRDMCRESQVLNTISQEDVKMVYCKSGKCDL